MEKIKDTTFYFDEQEIAHTLVKTDKVYTKKEVVEKFKNYCNSEECIKAVDIKKDGIRAFESTVDINGNDEIFRIIIHENNFESNKNEIFNLNEIVQTTSRRLISIPEDNVAKVLYERHMNEFKKLLVTLGILTSGAAAIILGQHVLEKHNLKSPIDIIIDIDNKKFEEETKQSEEYYQQLQEQKNHEESLEISGKSL